MALEEIQRSETHACKRIYYRDEQGNLVERLLHDGDEHEAVMEENEAARQEFSRHNGDNVRRIASIPADLMLKWLYEEEVPGYCGPEAMDFVINKKLRDPEVKHLLTVPDDYEFKKYQ